MDVNKWVHRVVVGVVAVLVGRTIWLAGQRESRRSAGNRELAAAVAETGKADPNWRWDTLNAARRRPPAGKNGADLVPVIQSRMPKAWGGKLNDTNWAALNPTPPPNVRFHPDVIDAARAELARAGGAVELARTLKDYPNGHRVIELDPTVVGTLLTDTQHTRQVLYLLKWETVAAVEDGDRGRAADDLLAMLNASRSVGDEPFLISQLVRIATRTVAAHSLEWALAQTDLPEPALARLQAAWAADAEEPLLLYGLRGERAAMDVFFANLTDGTLDPGAVLPILGGRPDAGRFSWWLYRARAPAERAFVIRWYSQAITAAERPVHEQRAALAALPFFEDPATQKLRFHAPTTPVVVDGRMLVLAPLLIPAVGKVAGAHWRGTAEGRCAAVGIACERFRLRHGRWPKTLAELPADLLPAVPLDPFDGKPLRFRRLADGVVVYSVGLDRADDGGALSREGVGPSKDVGFRLWDPDHRRQPPPPRPQPEPGDPEDRP